MYSTDWFETFAETIPPATMERELDGIAALLPLDDYPRVLDVGCGSGRVAGPMSLRGYRVTGLDVAVDALRRARRRHPHPRWVALDQRHVGRLGWRFDAALVLWNSLGFAGRSADRETLRGLASVLRPGGKLLLDLYHPDWLLRSGSPDGVTRRGATSIRRWMDGGRCFNEIRYAGGRVDRIEFAVYRPGEIRELAGGAGFEPGPGMVWWDPAVRPGPESARYQMVCRRRGVSGPSSPSS